MGHTEAGHTYVALHPYDVKHEFKGMCPFHNGCLEGLAAGPSLEGRTGIRGELIELNSDVWDVQAYYIAQAAYRQPCFIVRKSLYLVEELWLKSTCLIVYVRSLSV